MTTNRITQEMLITSIVGIGIWCSAKRHDGQEFVGFDDTNIPAACALIARSLIGEDGSEMMCRVTFGGPLVDRKPRWRHG